MSSPYGLLLLDTNVVVFSIRPGAGAKQTSLEARMRQNTGAAPT